MLCNSTLVAQAVVSSLGLHQAALAALRGRGNNGKFLGSGADAPVLAITVESDVGRVGPAIRELNRKWPRHRAAGSARLAGGVAWLAVGRSGAASKCG